MKNNRVITETQLIEPITNMLPFELKASFEKLFDYWKEVAGGDDEYAAVYARSVLDRVAHAKEIHEPFTDWTLFDTYKEEIDLLIQPLFPTATTKNEIKAAVLPFHPFPFAYSERFNEILKDAYEEFRFGADKDPNVFYRDACTFILNMMYNTNFDSKTPLVIDVKSNNEELARTYKAFINGDFTSIKATDRAPKLTPADIDRLLSDNNNMDLWKEKLPPNSYIFEGFAIINLFEITKDQALSNLKSRVVGKKML